MRGPNSGATFSPCRQYRYTLWRQWNDDGPELVFIMLNPSTADEIVLDPTVTRCLTRAQRGHYGKLTVLNIFAFRSTNPLNLYTQADPVGPDNDKEILEAAKRGSDIICGWGNHGRYQARGAMVRELLWSAGRKIFALKTTSLGEPWHPLYLPYSAKPFEMEMIK